MFVYHVMLWFALLVDYFPPLDCTGDVDLNVISGAYVHSSTLSSSSSDSYCVNVMKFESVTSSKRLMLNFEEFYITPYDSSFELTIRGTSGSDVRSLHFTPVSFSVTCIYM